ncbi:hypothetical protein EON83_20215 [bacterium]|nr:MAG: hypothetical protein EON83_20215 [bacterium]
MHGDRQFFYRVEGGDWRDEEGEFPQACLKMAGEGGYLPKDFPLLQVALEYKVLPSQLLKEPAFWVKRMQLQLAVSRQAESDRAANAEARAKAGL